jgi:hypothetical protein
LKLDLDKFEIHQLQIACHDEAIDVGRSPFLGGGLQGEKWGPDIVQIYTTTDSFLLPYDTTFHYMTEVFLDAQKLSVMG